MLAGGCDGATGTAFACMLLLRLRTGAAFMRGLSTGYFRGRPLPRLTGRGECSVEPESSITTLPVLGEPTRSSLGAGEGRLGCGVAAEGGLDCIAAAAVIGVGTCAVTCVAKGVS